MQVGNEWIKEYTEYLKAGDFENMLDLKMKHFPASFFKYRAVNSYTLNCLAHNKLWMSEVDAFNDPFECSLLLDNAAILKGLFSDGVFLKKLLQMGFSETEIKVIRLSEDPFGKYKSILMEKGVKFPYTPEQQRERVESAWEKDKEEKNRNIRICSFSATNESILMWSRYGNSHKGICIEYDFLDHHELRAFLQPVYYDKYRPSVTMFKNMGTYYNVYVSICKSPDWAYEREWRLTFFTESQIKGKNNFVGVPPPSAIYLGPRFDLNPEDVKAEFHTIVKGKSIPLYSMVIHRSGYRIVRAS